MTFRLLWREIRRVALEKRGLGYFGGDATQEFFNFDKPVLDRTNKKGELEGFLR